MDRRTELWLKQHDANERRLAVAIAAFFAWQLSRVIAALDDFLTLTPTMVAHVFHPDEERREFLRIIESHWLAAAIMGAVSEAELLHGLARRGGKLTASVRDSINSFWSDAARQSYWRDIQAGTSRRLVEVIQQSVARGDDVQATANAIRETLGDKVSEQRALAIARTETTGAMNAGHQAQLIETGASGIVLGKTWLTMEDEVVRLTHSALQDHTIKPEESFLVGGNGLDTGWPAAFPGDWRLPPEERINCRCMILPVVAGDSVPT